MLAYRIHPPPPPLPPFEWNNGRGGFLPLHFSIFPSFIFSITSLRFFFYRFFQMKKVKNFKMTVTTLPPSRLGNPIFLSFLGRFCLVSHVSCPFSFSFWCRIFQKSSHCLSNIAVFLGETVVDSVTY